MHYKVHKSHGPACFRNTDKNANKPFAYERKLARDGKKESQMVFGLYSSTKGTSEYARTMARADDTLALKLIIRARTLTISEHITPGTTRRSLISQCTSVLSKLEMLIKSEDSSAGNESTRRARINGSRWSPLSKYHFYCGCALQAPEGSVWSWEDFRRTENSCGVGNTQGTL